MGAVVVLRSSMCWLVLLAAWPAMAAKPVEIDTAQSRIGFTLKTRWGQSLDGRFPQWRGEISANCQIKLKLSEAVAIIMHAVVAHVEGRRAGLRCTILDVDSATHLRQLVALNAGDPALLERELSALLAEQ